MQRWMNKYGALLFAGVLAVTGCQGEKGANGVNGTDGTDGTNGQDGMSAVTGKLKLVIDGVQTTATASTLTFTIYPAAAACPGGTCDDALGMMTQKVFYASEYDAATKTFTTAHTFQFNGGFKFKAIVDGGKGAQFTAVTKAGVNPNFVPETSQSAMIYGYIADANVLAAPATGHYAFPDNVASAGKVYGTIDYESSANVTGCEKCHGKPYSKHGYRQATVVGLPVFASCKACHTGQRVGSDMNWQVIVDDPAAYAALPKDAKGAPILTDAMKTTYAYTANVMNDTHMSHAMEFNFPQSMANCVTCHDGKLDVILADANFKISTCKSCHPVNGKGGTDSKRAPALLGDGTTTNPGIMPAAIHGSMNLATTDCLTCHKAGGARTFKQIHSGRTAAIYDDSGARFADAVKTTIDAASYDPATYKLTVDIKMTGLAANALVKPTLVVSLYGYGTKDFVVSGHSTQADGTTNLEYTYGAMQRANPTLSSNSARLTLSPDAPTAGTTSWTAVADLSLWAAKIGADKQVQRVEIAFLPSVGRDQTALVSATNPAVAVTGKTATLDLVGSTTLVADASAYGKNIVDPAKCNACHDALGTTFHGPNYGSAGVVACRTCHTVQSGGSHLEMQSRSIDSYIHAIHSMQAFDPGDINYADPIAVLRHELHVEGNYPNFAGTLNCNSCHSSGTYEVPDQTRSLPSLLSGSDPVANRNIQNVPSYVVGPASRACGSCHRAKLINEDDAGTLAAFNQHTAMFGTLVAGTSANLDAVTQDIMSQIGVGPAFTGTAVAGAQVESCVVCHPNAGTDHQAAFDRWADGL
ncbi:hypothetical protein [Anaeromyxobacter sp. SG64]|uniref:multiheme c-type cytochrome n=1 Tax=Anaeromyxobacter sp. SG64 TaxID=2925409 RepID=UPI001F55AB8F|nr:hypothetical protein [Anaeromyxobacter sp. SG64]